MLKSLRCAAFAIAALAPAFASAQDAAQGGNLEVKATHGSWNIVCAPNGDCAMEQVGKNPEGGDVLRARIIRIQPRDTPQGTLDTLFTAVAPLGVALRPGLAVQIDGGPLQRMPFEICDRNGCIVQTLVPAAFIDNMKKGVKATFGLTAPNNQQISTEINLSGFTKAYNTLTPAK